jgi:hypothetical protein
MVSSSAFIPVTRIRRSGREAFSPAIKSNKFCEPRLPRRIRSISLRVAISAAVTA